MFDTISQISAPQAEEAPIVAVEPTVEPTAQASPTPEPPIAAPQAAPVAEAPVTQVSDWREELKKHTGGKIADETSLTQLMQDYEARQLKIQELEAKDSSLPEIARKLRDLQQSGATKQDIDRFLKMQTLNVDTMSSIDKIRQKMQSENPYLTPDLIDLKIEDAYGSVNESEIEGLKKAELLNDAAKATEFLKSQIVASENPDAIRLKSEENANFAKYQADMTQTFSQLYATGAAAKVDASVEGMPFEFALNADQQNQVLSLTMQQMVSNKLPIGDTENRKGLIEKFTFALYGKEIVAAAVKNAKALSAQATIAEVSGAKITPSVTEAPKAVNGDIWGQIAQARRS